MNRNARMLYLQSKKGKYERELSVAVKNGDGGTERKKFEVFLDWGLGLNAFVLLTLPLSGSDFEAFNAG